MLHRVTLTILSACVCVGVCLCLWECACVCVSVCACLCGCVHVCVLVLACVRLYLKWADKQKRHAGNIMKKMRQRNQVSKISAHFVARFKYCFWGRLNVKRQFVDEPRFTKCFIFLASDSPSLPSPLSHESILPNVRFVYSSPVQLLVIPPPDSHSAQLHSK